MYKAFLILVLFFTIKAGLLFAHGDLDEQIVRLSQRIEKDSNNAQLYLKRGQVYFQHGDFEEAKKDYFKTRELDGKLDILDFLLAKLYAKHNLPDTALIYVNVFLKEHPENPNALISRAGIHRQLGDLELSQQDLAKALKGLKPPQPRHYIDIAETILYADSTNYSEALEWIEEGQSQFVFDIVLQTKKVELLVKDKQYENAILGIENIMNNFSRKEKWYLEKAKIYEKMKEHEQALEMYQASLTAIQNLPTRLQKTTAIIELEALALEGILKLEK